MWQVWKLSVAGGTGPAASCPLPKGECPPPALRYSPPPQPQRFRNLLLLLLASMTMTGTGGLMRCPSPPLLRNLNDLQTHSLLKLMIHRYLKLVNLSWFNADNAYIWYNSKNKLNSIEPLRNKLSLIIVNIWNFQKQCYLISNRPSFNVNLKSKIKWHKIRSKCWTIFDEGLIQRFDCLPRNRDVSPPSHKFYAFFSVYWPPD